jgi:hypothetical protein
MPELHVPVPILPLERACQRWLGGTAWPIAFKLERDGLLKITRIDDEYFIAADDAQRCIDACRGKAHRPGADVDDTEGAAA